MDDLLLVEEGKRLEALVEKHDRQFHTKELADFYRKHGPRLLVLAEIGVAAAENAAMLAEGDDI